MNIETVLSKVVPPQGFTMQATPESFRAQVEAARDHLKSCMQNRDAAARALTEAQAAVDRVRSLISAADSADAELKTAEESSKAFTRRWAENGAPADSPATDPKLKSRADAAARAAVNARIAADGAEDGLTVANATLWSSKNALSTAEQNVGHAVAGVLASMIESQFAIAQQAAATLDEASHDIQACAKALAGRFRPFSSDSTAAGLLNRLQVLAPQQPRQDTRQLIQRGDDLLERSREFVELGTRLLKDGDSI